MAYYVYLLTARKDGPLYLGVTNDLVRRVFEHRSKAVDSFTSRYHITKLVWFGGLRRSDHGDLAGEGNQEVAASVEGCVDRAGE